MDFFETIEQAAREKATSLCVGLDPRVTSGPDDVRSRIVTRNLRLIEATAPWTLCYKPNLAFYEAHGVEGLRALEETIAAIPREIPVIVDAKRCDIDATAAAYAEAIFGRLSAWGHALAVTLSPYMGRDAVEPFLAYPGTGIFMLCRTSNPGAGVFQDLSVRSAAPEGREGSVPGPVPASGESPLYLRVARECSSWSDRIGLVVAGNDPECLRSVRSVAPDAWFLAPGIGAQGGDAAGAFDAGARDDGYGILVMAARSVAGAEDPGAAAKALRDSVESMRTGRSGSPGRGRSGPPVSDAGTGAAHDGPEHLKRELFTALIRTGCFRLGDFVLKSGKRSPFYIDLRRLVSDPRALELAGKAYASAANHVVHSRIAGIPAAALPLATAASMATGVPMIWPRMPVKDHGTGNRVEGAFDAGERVLLLDDLITTGASKLEAAAILRGEGLVVEDLVVLLERGTQGRRDMEANGIRLHAFAHVRELFAQCERLGLIDASARADLERFVDSE